MMTKLKMALAAAFVSLFGAVGLVVAQPSAAQANQTPAFYPSDCSSSAYICFYDNTNGTGLLVKAAPSVYPKSVCHVATPSERKTSYISNPTSESFVVYLNTSCSGTSAPVYAHSSGAMNSTWNNKIQSFFRA